MATVGAQLKILSMFSVMALSSMASALDVNALQGRVLKYNSPSGKSEACVLSNKLVPGAYKKADLKDENTLCGYDFYSNMAVCSKLNSTNPGVLVVELLQGKTRAETQRMCMQRADDISVEAKFKNSISCSYTPSILAYYHFSRMLGGAGNVPVAVLRTMDRQEHLNIANQALNALKGKEQTLIYKTWSSFASAHRNLNDTSLFDTSKNFVYGALSDNPKREEQYTEVSGAGSYDTRYERFVKQRPYLNVASTKTVEQIAGSNDYKKVLHYVTQMKDVSDMVLMDTLFSQDDRIGNIHYNVAWYIETRDQATGKTTFDIKKSKAKYSQARKTWQIPEKEQAIQQAGGLLVKQMLLKDNDCGVNVNKRSNMMRKVSALEGVRHMSAKTYRNFIEIYKASKKPEFLNWMKSELLFTDADLGLSSPRMGRSFLANLDKAYSILNTNCKNGSLKLDLNVDDLIPGNTPTVVSCD